MNEELKALLGAAILDAEERLDGCANRTVGDYQFGYTIGYLDGLYAARDGFPKKEEAPATEFDWPPLPLRWWRCPYCTAHNEGEASGQTWCDECGNNPL